MSVSWESGFAWCMVIVTSIHYWKVFYLLWLVKKSHNNVYMLCILKLPCKPFLCRLSISWFVLLLLFCAGIAETENDQCKHIVSLNHHIMGHFQHSALQIESRRSWRDRVTAERNKCTWPIREAFVGTVHPEVIVSLMPFCVLHN